ncbi:hypothetical protein CC1G_13853 [Coprinopsis cinerea okayama7|uniref:Uncharacterized protein n=1 Tax=Coprinopsis cinerea (strain Okayama-7 / 130 / ATCC MYA-4618 / FGSC 9003) TaxID=240176 RepID=D6RKV5_COPC7|nr:hypothetical protein CC1G_13853 [Coprinopsis cinerea okayama7\|eukprot:XP_002911818.1 hypothetical protein CC1G_13853 [Coprinopsis cinerea okayama7\
MISFVSPNYEDEVEAKITHVTEIRYYPPSGRARDMGCLRSMYEKHKAAMLPLRDNEKGLKKYIEEQREILSGYRRFISALRRWEDNYPGDKVAYADQKRRDQELIYMSYLEKLGFKDEAEMMGLSALQTLPRFRNWEKITPQVIEIMTEVRETLAKKSRDEAMALAKRKKEESIQMRLAHLNAVREYYVLRHRHEIVPNVVDLAIAEPFFSLITGTPYDEPVTSKEFIPLLDHIPRISQEWREAAMDLLLGLMAQPSGSGGTLNKGKEKDKRFSPDRSVLDRATTFFSCIWCTEILAYPTVLTHPCVSQKRRSTAKSDDRGAPSDSGDFFLNYWDVTIWNRSHDQLEYDHETSECAKHLVTLCGKDPASLTLEAMDQLDVRFECLRCHKPNFKEGRLVMNWRNALMHEFKKHSEQDTFKTGWLLLSDEDTVTAKAKEVIAAQKNGLNVPPQYYCVECSFSHIEDGQIFYPPGRYPPPLKGPDSKCSRNHDMSHGVFEQHRYPRNVKVAGFVGDTLPVKI